MTHICDVHYSPFLRCGGSVCARLNNNNLCAFHIFQLKRHDECPICLDKMSCEGELIVLLCGHMFHTKCLHSLEDPLCPLCRQQMHPKEAKYIFEPKVLEPIAIQLYSLPPTTIKYVIHIFHMILYLADCGNDNIFRIWSKLYRMMNRQQRN